MFHQQRGTWKGSRMHISNTRVSGAVYVTGPPGALLFDVKPDVALK